MNVTPTACDFETKKIEDRPVYPPKPVGLAIRQPDGTSRYYAWGHPSGNNCNELTARRAYEKACKSGPVVFHNGAFDMEVAQSAWGVPFPAEWHDTLFLSYFQDPHAYSLGLKEQAAARLGIPAEEQENLRDWIINNVPGVKRNKTDWAAYIAQAPGDMVAPYAIGDVSRTASLFRHDYGSTIESGMGAAYDRERRLLPILLRNTQQGVRVDLPALERDVPRVARMLDIVDQSIRVRLKSPDLEVDKTAQLIHALDRAGKMSRWLLTPKGKKSTSKAALEWGMADDRLRAIILYREALATCLRTFMRPWLEGARGHDGTVQVDWNSTRQDDGSGGTRTGRLSSSPNFQNIYSDENLAKAESGVLWEIQNLRWMRLPRVRGYIIADPGHVLCDRDFAQQELRVLAHFENGQMMQTYLDNPTVDLHEYASRVIYENTGIMLPRKQTKNMAFGLMYGMGIAGLARRLGVGKDQAANARKAYLGTFEGVAGLLKELKRMSKVGEPMRTWGGRVYYAEKPKVFWNPEFEVFEKKEYGYKMLNYLIQGSSADITKEAVLRYESCKREGRLVLTVHDEIVIDVPKKAWKAEMEILKSCMNGIELDVPLLSDGEVGERWTNMGACA